MEQAWYVARNKQRQGPFGMAQLQQQVASGILQPTDMLLQAGAAKWMQASSVEGLFPAQVPSAPPASAAGSTLPPSRPAPSGIGRGNLTTDTVVFGTRVLVKDLDLGGEECFELVDLGDEDYDNNKIFADDPVGQGLLGKKKGEVVEIKVPAGTLHFEILEILSPEEQRKPKQPPPVFCSFCGCVIPAARLATLPDTTTCVKCSDKATQPTRPDSQPMAGFKPGRKGTPPGWRAGRSSEENWICPNCKAHNFARREDCHQCRMPRPS